MKRIYITGVSGTGKTTISNELKKRGILSLDISIKNPNLDCYWENKKTKERVQYKPDADMEWFKLHGRICDPVVLKNYLNNHKEIVVITGLASNQDEYLDIFDEVILLQCKEEVFLNRMENRTTNLFGKKQIEREQMLGWYKDFEKNLIQKGAKPLNNDGDISEIVERVIMELDLL